MPDIALTSSDLKTVLLSLDEEKDPYYVLRACELRPLNGTEKVSFSSRIIDAVASLAYMEGTAIDLFPQGPETEGSEDAEIKPVTYYVLQTVEEIQNALKAARKNPVWQTKTSVDLRGLSSLSHRFNVYKENVVASLEEWGRSHEQEADHFHHEAEQKQKAKLPLAPPSI